MNPSSLASFLASFVVGSLIEISPIDRPDVSALAPCMAKTDSCVVLSFPRDDKDVVIDAEKAEFWLDENNLANIVDEDGNAWILRVFAK